MNVRGNETNDILACLKRSGGSYLLFKRMVGTKWCVPFDMEGNGRPGLARGYGWMGST